MFLLVVHKSADFARADRQVLGILDHLEIEWRCLLVEQLLLLGPSVGP
jgi:hypothetical protein